MEGKGYDTVGNDRIGQQRMSSGEWAEENKVRVVYVSLVCRLGQTYVHILADSSAQGWQKLRCLDVHFLSLYSTLGIISPKTYIHLLYILKVALFSFLFFFRYIQASSCIYTLYTLASLVLRLTQQISSWYCFEAPQVQHTYTLYYFVCLLIKSCPCKSTNVIYKIPASISLHFVSCETFDENNFRQENRIFFSFPFYSLSPSNFSFKKK